ncbi:MAG: methylated-DNA--[protein]-cysteine S-methyltransferase [Caldilineales bacterium]|nr:methylated-DNA--[protein]-cysteine S-methyltransferase [Caldilineales bacterium]
MLYYNYFESPIGLIEIGGTDKAIISLVFVGQMREESASNALLDGAARQIAEYFAGSRQEFDLPLDMQGTDFQRSVWTHLLSIPYGVTISYMDIANALGNPQSIRAVGAANGQNPISIIVPCHRVIGSDGKLVGYGGGLWRKEWLLRHEGGLLL